MTIPAGSSIHRICAVALIVAAMPQFAGCGERAEDAATDAQAIVVGAGLSGLSAAVEMGRKGVTVLVIDMNSVAGGHAVLAGGVALVATPVQAAAGIEDNPDKAYRDWMEWTEDGDPGWTRYYAEHSRDMIYDWVTEMGVEFVRVAPGHGNSVSRFHFTRGRALHLVLPIFREALRLPSVSFLFSHRVDELLLEDGRVSGVVVTDLRSGEQHRLRAPNVVLATGGFENDLERVLANWTPGLPRPKNLLSGAAISATGSGHDMAEGAGAGLQRIDRHYIYVNGLPDPRDPERHHALTAGNELSMWVNAQGRRFTNETGFDKDILVDLLRQDPDTYWAIFDGRARDDFRVRGAAWLNNDVPGDPVLDDPAVTISATSIRELALKAGLPADVLEASVRRFNTLVASGQDTDFGRFDRADDAPPPIQVPPFYALQLFPMTRKNMGGVAVDREARVLDAQGNVLPGLYAVGELNGSVGINGRHGLDGMFLGPGIITGRLAGQSIAARYPPSPSRGESPADAGASAVSTPQPALTATALELMVGSSRPGYWHFEVSHGLVLERGYECRNCHSSRLPFASAADRETRLAQTAVCETCH